MARELHVRFVGKPKYDSRYFSTSGRGYITLPCMETDWPEGETIAVVRHEDHRALQKKLDLAVEGLKEIEQNQESEWCFWKANQTLKHLKDEGKGEGNDPL